MSTQPENFNWRQFPEAEKVLLKMMDEFISSFPAAKSFERDLGEKTSIRLPDIVDHLLIPASADLKNRLAGLGFREEDVPMHSGHRVLYHPEALFPRLVLEPPKGEIVDTPRAVALGVENLPKFLSYHNADTDIEGAPLSGFRCAELWEENRRTLVAVERRGDSGFLPQRSVSGEASLLLKNFERWLSRQRFYSDTIEGLKLTLQLAKSIISELGVNLAAWVIFSAERAYWEQRNHAAQVQKRRQDAMGLGWANHDHHTFRASRGAFPWLIEILTTLGFELREKFYAGAEAGWGAQILEHSVCRLVVFADVDLSPEEVETDFINEALPPREKLGTVGLWCALHGESILAAGLHHLACRFNFEQLSKDLAAENVKMLEPFSDLPFLKQAFTEGADWKIREEKLTKLLEEKRIANGEFQKFKKNGAVGSHLENIQRRDGFKGFNQQSVSDIIRRTDPRTGYGAA